MLISKKRPIIIPQFEHTRLSATIAFLWGNDDFEKTTLPSDSFIKGVLFHDRGYGYLDNFPLGSLTIEQRKATLIKGIEESFNDPIADIVTLLHIKRLTSSSTMRDELTDVALECEKVLSEKMKVVSVSETEFAFADRIVDLADSIAFDFSLEEDSKDSGEVSSRHGSNDLTSINFSIKGNVISMTPWPLSVERYEGFIVGYQKNGYPEKLDPCIIPFILQK